MCVFIYVCVCVCIYIYIYIYICVCVCVCVYIYVCVYMCVCVCVYIYMCVCVCVCVCVYVYISMCVCIYICIYIYIYLYIYIYIYIYIYMFSSPNEVPLFLCYSFFYLCLPNWIFCFSRRYQSGSPYTSTVGSDPLWEEFSPHKGRFLPLRAVTMPHRFHCSQCGSHKRRTMPVYSALL